MSKSVGSISEQFETVTLLDICFHKLTQPQLFNEITRAAKNPKKIVIANVNVRAMNLAYDLDWFQTFLRQAEIVFCDGFGVVLAAWLTGQRIQAKHRLTCPDWIADLAVMCSQNNLALFLLAGEPGVAQKAAMMLRKVAPNLRIAAHHGYFQKTGPENEQVVAEINAFKPDILYVGFGMPLQEQWIQTNFDRLDAKIFLPLGACLDFYTARLYRGPRWLTNYGWEWLARLFTEPRRLWWRYIVGNPRFLWRVLRQQLKQRL